VKDEVNQGHDKRKRIIMQSMMSFPWVPGKCAVVNEVSCVAQRRIRIIKDAIEYGTAVYQIDQKWNHQYQKKKKGLFVFDDV